MKLKNLQLKYSRKNVGYLLVTLRSHYNYPACYVATKIGVSKSTYSKIEQGQQDLGIERMVSICTVFGITPYEFWEHFVPASFF